MKCPKCQTDMRERERETGTGVVVMDACPSCGGIWLDKGELEQLTAAESRLYSKGDDDEGDDDDNKRGGQSGQRGGRKRGGFLGNLLDFGD